MIALRLIEIDEKLHRLQLLAQLSHLRREIGRLQARRDEVREELEAYDRQLEAERAL